ncbi:hypothetical protein FA13DRAFT_1716183 [Coprinellus micaceus]|uniref:Uncharacterized protein n=1 Tax=Coprinellus micaceus TaxID=71717 RepID=A0A4Y7SKB2_COPMI|nr:hypothetical protein FA13DRAFT_1716183 [Coprinellus micaceus]
MSPHQFCGTNCTATFDTPKGLRHHQNTCIVYLAFLDSAQALQAANAAKASQQLSSGRSWRSSNSRSFLKLPAKPRTSGLVPVPSVVTGPFDGIPTASTSSAIGGPSTPSPNDSGLRPDSPMDVDGDDISLGIVNDVPQAIEDLIRAAHRTVYGVRPYGNGT